MTPRVHDWLAHHALRDDPEPALIEVASGRLWSYREFHERSGRMAVHLREKLGVVRGDRVSVLAENSADTFVVQFACARLGAIFNPLNWRLAHAELDYIVRDAAPRALVSDTIHAANATALARAAGVAHRLTYDAPGSAGEFEGLLAASSGACESVPELSFDDPWTLMYTSGTTGRPKGALITHGMTFFNAVNTGMELRISHSSVCLTVLPLFHTGGLNLWANPTFHAGGTVVLARRFDPAQTLGLLADGGYGITHFFGVPANFLFMQQDPAFADAHFGELTVGVGGAPTPRAIVETWYNKGVVLLPGYGMTETGPTVTATPPHRVLDKIGSVGQQVLHTTLRVVDRDGADVPPGEVGEVWAKGPTVTPGYWNLPDATAESITDGWLHTGDAGRIDADGFVWIVDRWKDMYISGGENVYPAEVEDLIFQHAAVADVAVVGAPNERWGEVGVAFVVTQPGATLTAEEVVEHCRGALAGFKIPARVVFVDALPRNATGKVMKAALKADLDDGFGRQRV